MLVWDEGALMNKNGVMLILLAAMATLTSREGSVAAAKSSSRGPSFMAEELNSSRYGHSLVEENISRNSVETLDKGFGFVGLVPVGPEVVADGYGGGCPGNAVVIPSNSYFSSLESTNESIAIVGPVAGGALAVGISCPLADPANPVWHYLLLSTSGKLVRSLGSGQVFPTAVGGNGLNLFLGGMRNSSVASLVERKIDSTRLGAINTVQPGKRCGFNSAPTFYPASSSAVVMASCSRSKNSLILEKIQEFMLEVATVNLPARCDLRSGEEAIALSANKEGLLVSEVTPSGNFPKSGGVELVNPAGHMRLISTKMFNAVWLPKVT
jgi:hypothetical protein